MKRSEADDRVKATLQYRDDERTARGPLKAVFRLDGRQTEPPDRTIGRV